MTSTTKVSSRKFLWAKLTVLALLVLLLGACSLFGRGGNAEEVNQAETEAIDENTNPVVVDENTTDVETEATEAEASDAEATDAEATDAETEAADTEAVAEASAEESDVAASAETAATEAEGSTEDAVAIAQTSAVIRIEPATGQINTGETLAVEVRVDNVENLFAADIEIQFDASLLQVQDGDPNKDGVQVSPGTFPAPDFVAENTVDNSAGVIRYALTQLPPSQPLNGSGVILSLTFQGLADGTSNVRIVKFDLATNQAQVISATPQDGSITIGAGGPTATPAPTETPLPGITPTPTPGPTNTPDPGATPTLTPVPGTPTPTPIPPTGEVRRYVVKPGDTLFSISRRYGVPLFDLATYNNIYNVNLIYVGQVLLIPTSTTPPGGGTGTTYTIKHGDTLYSIGRSYGYTVNQLVAYNNIQNPNLIYAGQTLYLPPR